MFAAVKKLTDTDVETTGSVSLFLTSEITRLKDSSGFSHLSTTSKYIRIIASLRLKYLVT